MHYYAVPPGYSTNSLDCNDNNPNIHPGVTEICNLIDDNCNDLTDEGLPVTTYYFDFDGDSFGNTTLSTKSCMIPLGYSINNTDCNDFSSYIHPGQQEICNGIDDNCNDLTDEGLPVTTYYFDFDGDSFGNTTLSTKNCMIPLGYSINNTDCNDFSSYIHPGQQEICNGIDDNCNDLTDEGLPVTTYYQDVGNSGLGNPNIYITTCSSTPPPGYVSNSNYMSGHSSHRSSHPIVSSHPSQNHHSASLSQHHSQHHSSSMHHSLHPIVSSAGKNQNGNSLNTKHSTSKGGTNSQGNNLATIIGVSIGALSILLLFLFLIAAIILISAFAIIKRKRTVRIKATSNMRDLELTDSITPQIKVIYSYT